MFEGSFANRAIAIEFAKTFGKVYQKGLIYKHFSYDIFGRVYTMIKSFPTGMSMRVVFGSL